MFRKVIFVLMMCVFQLGLCLLLFPVFKGFLLDRQVGQAAQSFLTQVDTPIEETQSIDPTEETIPYQQLWDEMCAYNETLYAEKQVSFDSPDDYEQPSFNLLDYGLEDEVFAVLTARKINLEMPVYLGATDTHLAHGASHLSLTSLPIGGENTNCVIAGHRGYNGASYFRYIEKLKVGDVVSITNLWETLTYRVAEIKIIDPHEVKEILIQDGRDLVTLLTCHPYASGGRQRYVVYCERIETAITPTT